MGFNRILQWLLPVLMSLFLVTGCGDLEPEMQDTRTVILNMDFHGKSSSRSSSSVSAAELSNYKPHLIMALPSRESLTSSYKNYYSSFAQGLMNTADKKVSLEIPLNTQMKIFAFLFKENYSMSELILGTHTVGYYGESQTFSISTNTNSLSLGITLKAASGNEDDSTGDGGDQGGIDTTAPVIAEVYPVTTPTSDSTPDYTFHTTEAGTITYGGGCSSSTTNATKDNNTITFNTLSAGTYSNCTITVMDNASNMSAPLAVSSFTVTSSSSDTTKPQITGLSFSPSSIDTSSSSQTVTATISITDDTALPESNGSNFSVRFMSPSQNQFIDFYGYTGQKKREELQFQERLKEQVRTGDS